MLAPMRLVLGVLTASAVLAVAAPAGAMVGGTPVPVESTVKLGIVKPSGNGVCSGSVISPSVVLTAAHCVDGATAVEVISGRDDLSDEATGQRFQAVRWTVVPGWSQVNHDMAYVDLDGESTAPAVPLQQFVPAAGAVIQTRGYGRAVAGGDYSRTLLGGDVEVVTCPKGSAGPGGFCTRVTPAHPMSPCQGDSGGPALSGGALIGVASGASANCDDIAGWSSVAGETSLIADARAPRITGRVAQPPSPAQVRALRADGSVAATATTDAQGGFVLPVGPGTYTVEAAVAGLVGTARDVAVSGPRAVGIALAAPPPVPRAVVAVRSATRRKDGQVVLKVRVAPPAGQRVRLQAIGALAVGKRGYDLGTTSFTATKTGTVSVRLKLPRKTRAQAKVGRTLRVGVQDAEGILVVAKLKLKR
jgi:trypsin